MQLQGMFGMLGRKMKLCATCCWKRVRRENKRESAPRDFGLDVENISMQQYTMFFFGSAKAFLAPIPLPMGRTKAAQTAPCMGGRRLLLL